MSLSVKSCKSEVFCAPGSFLVVLLGFFFLVLCLAEQFLKRERHGKLQLPTAGFLGKKGTCFPEAAGELKSEGECYHQWQVWIQAQSHLQEPGTNNVLLPSPKDQILRAASLGSLRRPLPFLFRFGRLQSSTTMSVSPLA